LEHRFQTYLEGDEEMHLLKKDEARRQEEQVDADLTARGYQLHGGLKLPAKLQLLRQDITEKEEMTKVKMMMCDKTEIPQAILNEN
jgi:hypothetical protein